MSYIQMEVEPDNFKISAFDNHTRDLEIFISDNDKINLVLDDDTLFILYNVIVGYLKSLRRISEQFVDFPPLPEE